MSARKVKRWSVTGVVVGSKYLGDVEAATGEEALQKAGEELDVGVSFCHACADECSDPEIETLVVSHGNERVTDREDDWQARARAAGWTPPAEAPALDLGEPPVFALTLSTRAHRVLTSAGIISVSGLLDRTAGDLLNIRGCGATTVAEIRAALARHGLRLAGDAS